VLGQRVSIVLAWALVSLTAGCASTIKPPNQPQSWTDKVGSSFKSGTDKFAAAIAPKPKAPVETELQPDKKPGPGVYVAMAELQERGGNIEEAETLLRKALSMDQNHLGALLAYAHLEDRQKNFEAAIKYYQKAARKHPKDASVQNDMGLCFHRKGKLEDAAKSLKKATELESHKKLYHDNLAAVLVDQGNTDEALRELSLAHGDAVGNYNLGYLLAQKRDTAGALRHFQRAVQTDPSLTQANQWIAQLSFPATHYPAAQAAAPAAMMARREPAPSYAPGSIASDGRSQYQGQVPNGNYPPQGAQPNGQMPSSRLPNQPTMYR
jgi:Tfp pilus assembly protein PilF